MGWHRWLEKSLLISVVREKAAVFHEKYSQAKGKLYTVSSKVISLNQYLSDQIYLIFLESTMLYYLVLKSLSYNATHTHTLGNSNKESTGKKERKEGKKGNVRVKSMDASLDNGRPCSLLKAELPTVHHGAETGETASTHVLTTVLESWGMSHDCHVISHRFGTSV